MSHAALDQSPQIEARSVLLEWRGGELRICSGDAGKFSGEPFPNREDLMLLGFALERQRNGEAVILLCKHLVSTHHDGQDGAAHKVWRIFYRIRLNREGVYKLEARRGRFVPPAILAANYRPVGQNGHTLYHRAD